MANVINTRIQLKYDTLASWQTNNPTLLAGEIACVSIGEVTTDNKGNRVIPPIMMKVGPGAFNDLGWTAAKAADVYAWAKKETPDWTDFPALPIEVVDDEKNGKFITGITYADNKITITRADAVNSIAAEDNSLNFDKATGDVKAKVNISSTEGNILSLDGSGLYVPTPEKVAMPETDNVDNAATTPTGNTVNVVSNGALSMSEDGKYTLTENFVTVPTKEYVDNIDTGIMSVSGKEAIKVTEGADAEVSLALDPTSGNVILSQSDAGLKANVDLSNYQEKGNYKVIQNPVTDPEAEGTATSFIASITQDANGEIKVTKSTITASDLGLESAMHFVGAFPEAPADGNNGDVYLNTATKKEYVYSNNEWIELGDEGSYALKSITITGNNGLTGGGDLSANITIGLDKTAAKNTLGFVEAGEVSTAIANALTGNNATAVEKIANDAVTTAAIKNNAVTGDKIANEAITSAHFAAGAVAPEAGKVSNSLTIKGNGVVETTFDGSAAKTVTIDLSDYQEKGNYKIVQNAVVDPAADGKALEFIDSISQNANGEITATKKVVNLDAYAKSADLHEIATTGSIYDVAEGSNSGISKVNGEDVAVEYLIFNCGSATTII